MQYVMVSECVMLCFICFYYCQFDFDQVFSVKIFDCYLNLFDYSYNVLLVSDVEQFVKKKIELGDELCLGKFDVFYDFYNLV